MSVCVNIVNRWTLFMTVTYRILPPIDFIRSIRPPRVDVVCRVVIDNEGFRFQQYEYATYSRLNLQLHNTALRETTSEEFEDYSILKAYFFFSIPVIYHVVSKRRKRKHLCRTVAKQI